MRKTKVVGECGYSKKVNKVENDQEKYYDEGKQEQRTFYRCLPCCQFPTKRLTHFTCYLYFLALKRRQLREMQMPGGILQFGNFKHKYLASSFTYLWQQIPTWMTIRPLSHGRVSAIKPFGQWMFLLVMSFFDLTVSDTEQYRGFLFSSSQL